MSITDQLTGVVAAPVHTIDDVPARTPGTVHAVLFASACVLVGVLWDISWHQSIGRDSFFSPPHIGIYLGGVVAGLACGWVVLRTTFASSPSEKASAVSFWKFFHGPLGAWVCIWGSIAMITSAPFDDWWHNAYGLDTKILSPPHVLLAAGIGAINIGALLLVLPLQNRAEDAATRRRYARMVAVAAGLLLLMLATIVSEYHYRVFMHDARFYAVAGIAFPVVLAAAARAAAVRWGATLTALTYMGVTLLLMWTLPLFPAEPKLAPIYVQVTRMVPPSFPLLLIVPALAMDVIVQRFPAGRDWRLAAALGATFLITLLVAQWPFATFLMSDYAQNPVFAADNFPYQVPKTTYYYRRLFLPSDTGAAGLGLGLVTALVLCTLSARVGLSWGDWMTRVRR